MQNISKFEFLRIQNPLNFGSKIKNKQEGLLMKQIEDPKNFTKILSQDLMHQTAKHQKSYRSTFNQYQKKGKRQQQKSKNIAQLEYIADLRWLEEPFVVRKKFAKSSLQIIEKPSSKQIQFLIVSDLIRKGHQFRQNFTFRIFDIEVKKYKPNFLAKYLFGSRCLESKEFIIKCTIFEKKINLPRQFKYSPSKFQGFVVENLKIQNQNGSILWEGQTDVTSASFEEGIRIQKYEVQCEIPQLQKPAIIEFNSIPCQLEGISLKRAAKRLQKVARGAELISLDLQNKKWKLQLNFGKDQSQVEITEQDEQYEHHQKSEQHEEQKEYESYVDQEDYDRYVENYQTFVDILDLQQTHETQTQIVDLINQNSS